MTFPDVPGVTFRNVVGFPGYCVGNDGSVWTCRRNGGDGVKGQEKATDAPWRKRTPVMVNGYELVGLMRGAIQHGRHVHRLVLEAFVGPCPDGMEACHGPGGPLDNSVANLRWDTHVNNLRDRDIFGRGRAKGERQGHAKLTLEDVMVIRNSLRAPGMARALVEIYGVSKSQIHRIRKGMSWTWVEGIEPEGK